jgi:hypothetical protein
MTGKAIVHLKRFPTTTKKMNNPQGRNSGG